MNLFDDKPLNSDVNYDSLDDSETIFGSEDESELSSDNEIDDGIWLTAKD